MPGHFAIFQLKLAAKKAPPKNCSYGYIPHQHNATTPCRYVAKNRLT